MAKIVIGQQTPEHKGDTSRELLSMWAESGLCEIENNPDAGVFMWFNEVFDTLLYEYPRHDLYPMLPKFWSLALFANKQFNGFNCHPWTFWSRHPRALETKINSSPLRGFDERRITSVFLGKIENSIQHKRRTTHDWSTCLSEYDMPIGNSNTKHKYTQEEYLNVLSESKFGLSLPGYGPKCNREIEYFGLGVVPIFTNGVCLRYHNVPKEGTHYFKAQSPTEVQDIINKCSKQQWTDMSHAGREWYNNNCSRQGSFDVTMKIIERYR